MSRRNRRTRNYKSQKDKSNQTNKHGLKRYISSPTRRAIRKACYFGCVICGQLPYTYEHFDPPFKDAKEHDPEGMALLCGNHQIDTTSGRLSKERIAKARASPANASRDPSWTQYLDGPISLRFGGNVITGREQASVRVNETVLIGFKCKRDEVLLSGAFCDLDGKATLKFKDNEIVASQMSWDVEFEGTRLTIRAKQSQPVAIVCFDAESNAITVERLCMRFADGFILDGNSETLFLRFPPNNCFEFSKNNIPGFDFDFPAVGGWNNWTGAREINESKPAFEIRM